MQVKKAPKSNKSQDASLAAYGRTI